MTEKPTQPERELPATTRAAELQNELNQADEIADTFKQCTKARQAGLFKPEEDQR